jgi:hypothetical protein
MEGWRWLAEMLQVQRDARWRHLPEETVAEAAWPAFRMAVIAALEEHRAIREPRHERSSIDTHDAPLSG